jgi:hypothetical protein
MENFEWNKNELEEYINKIKIEENIFNKKLDDFDINSKNLNKDTIISLLNHNLPYFLANGHTRSSGKYQVSEALKYFIELTNSHYILEKINNYIYNNTSNIKDETIKIYITNKTDILENKIIQIEINKKDIINIYINEEPLFLSLKINYFNKRFEFESEWYLWKENDLDKKYPDIVEYGLILIPENIGYTKEISLFKNDIILKG